MSLFVLTLSLLACDTPTKDAPEPPKPGKRDVPTVTLKVEYGSEKKDWLEAEVSAFEETSPMLANGKKIVVDAHGQGSGEGMLDILSGKAQPDVYSPASSAYLSLLDDAWMAQAGHTGKLCGTAEPLLLSPVVIAMWKPMAEALGWPTKRLGWADILAVAASPKGWSGMGHPEWGMFKLAHTHPGLSNSGLLAVLAEAYAGAGKTRGLTAEDLQSPKVAAFLEQAEGSIVHYGKSTSFLSEKMIGRGPGYVSAAVLYENVVVQSYTTRPSDGGAAMPIVAIYPTEGTFWSDHPWSVLNAPWVTDDEKQAATRFLDFLKAKPAQQAAMAAGFRPADPSIPMASPLDAAHGVDPKEPQTLLDVPDGPTLTGVVAAWEAHKKPSDVVIVFDKSGSMNGVPLAKAKEGAKEFLKNLGDRDRVALEFFDNNVGTPSPWQALGGTGRADLGQLVDGAIADGGTSLYDATQAAVHTAEADATANPRAIHAVVVMTDGRDESSKSTLAETVAALSGHAEGDVKVFTIAYGDAADPTVLAQLAEAGRGMSAKGNSGDISTVFRDMAAFF